MTKKIHLLLLLPALLLAAGGCRKEPAPIQTIEPVYRYMAEYSSLDSLHCWPVPDSLQRSVDAFMQVMDLTPVTPAKLLGWSWEPPVEIFTPMVDSIFPSLRPLERQLGAVLHNARSQGLELPRREYAAVVWGKMQSIIFADSVMLIALNHYLGEAYEGYSSFPAYSRINKTPAMLPYDMAEALVGTSYPVGRENPTVLTMLLYEGAMVEAKMRLVPDARLEHALGYRSEQVEWLRQNERMLWQALLSRKLLFERSAMAINQLVGPAPTTRILSQYSPGRAGRYLGYYMVRAYLKRHPSATLAELLSPDFTAKPDILNEIPYNP